MRTQSVVAAIVAVCAALPAFAQGPRGKLIPVSAVPASSSVGRVTGFEGAVLVQHRDSVMPVQKGTLLGTGYSLVSAPNGRVQWWMEDDTVFTTVGTTDMRIDEFSRSSNTAHYTLSHGAARSVTGLMPHELLTPMGSLLGATGDYTAVICGEGCVDAPGLYVEVASGKLTLQNRAGKLMLGKGQVAFISKATQAPKLVLDPPSILLALSPQLNFEYATFGVEVEIDVDPPLIEGEPPISPS
jgi:hypothetical protein